MKEDLSSNLNSNDFSQSSNVPSTKKRKSAYHDAIPCAGSDNGFKHLCDDDAKCIIIID